MAITSVSSPSSASSSSSSSPTFSSSSPTTSRSSPVSMSTATLNMVSNGHFSAHQDYPSSSSAVKGININTNNSNNNSTHSSNNNGATIQNSMNNNSNHVMASYSNGFSSSFFTFGFPDGLSSSIPKSSHNNNSIHIGSLTNGLGGLSLSNYAPTTSSSLSSSLYSYSNNNNSNNTNGSSNPITATITNTSSLLSVTNSNTSPVGANGATLTATANGAVQEEISTIFVVGFPDDMHEREFQNMFVFTPGFEAATLKIPNKEPQEDDALTLDVNGVNPRKQIVSSSPPFLLSIIAHFDHLFALLFL